MQASSIGAWPNLSRAGADATRGLVVKTPGTRNSRAAAVKNRNRGLFPLTLVPIFGSHAIQVPNHSALPQSQFGHQFFRASDSKPRRVDEPEFAVDEAEYRHVRRR